MLTIRAFVAGSLRYYKCDNQAAADALLQVFALQKIEATQL